MHLKAKIIIQWRLLDRPLERVVLAECALCWCLCWLLRHEIIWIFDKSVIYIFRENIEITDRQIICIHPVQFSIGDKSYKKKEKKMVLKKCGDHCAGAHCSVSLVLCIPCCDAEAILNTTIEAILLTFSTIKSIWWLSKTKLSCCVIPERNLFGLHYK